VQLLQRYFFDGFARIQQPPTTIINAAKIIVPVVNPKITITTTETSIKNIPAASFRINLEVSPHFEQLT
jgi:hypothetical protein